MPDRLGPNARNALYIFMGIITVLSMACLIFIVVAVSYSGSARDAARASKASSASAEKAVTTLKASSSRNECRTQLVNQFSQLTSDAILVFQHNIADLLVVSGNDRQAALAIAEKMVDNAQQDLKRPNLNAAIEAICPPPIVERETYSYPTELPSGASTGR